MNNTWVKTLKNLVNHYMTDITHKPVLLKQTIDALNIKPNGVYLDCTLGSGGHTIQILNKGGKVYGLDIDPKAIKRTKERVKKACLDGRLVCPDAFFKTTKANFSKLEQVAQQFDISKVDGILMDLGLSSEQLEDQSRGFSFQSHDSLDMRADPELTVTAKDLVSALSKKELVKLLSTYGEESWAPKIAEAIIKARQKKPITTAIELSTIISQVVKHDGKTHKATKTFQALRMAVNDELNNLKTALPQAVKLLKTDGRLAIISFHSLEDKIVKDFIKNNSDLTSLTKKPITPDETEILTNPRSRSAKLRIAIKK
ncbi:16S rRNA (cytosine(1402)-N(4))-methyltransferase RsmH [Patescibacteria group bacterium]